MTDSGVIPADVQKSFNAFVKWYRQQSSIKPLGVEQIVYSKKHDVAGTFDCLLEIDGKTVLCDLKTTNPSRDAPLGVYPEMFLQLGAYAQMYKEESGKEPHDLAIINASKTGELNVVYASELGLSVQDCIDAWVRVLDTWKFLRPLSRKLKERKK